MELPQYLRLARANWAVFLICLVLGIGAAAGITAAQPPRYVATAKAFASTSTAANLNDLSQASAYSQQLVKSYADLATTSSVLGKVIDRLKLDTTPAALSSRVTAAAELDEVIVAVTATDSTPQGAARLANAVTEQLSTSVTELTPRASNGTAPVEIVQVDEASPPSAPDSPKPFVNMLVGFFLGLALALVIAAARQLFDTRIRSVAEAARVSGRAVLGSVSWIPTKGDVERSVILHDRGAGSEAEAYRTLRANVQFVDFMNDNPVLVITSALDGEGKSTTAANLAVAMADAGTKVVVVDADLRDPRLADYFGVDGSAGLTDVLTGRAAMGDVVQHWSSGGPDVIASGSIPPNPNDLIQSNRMRTLLDELRERYDIVLVDAPSLLAVSDAAILARESDATIVVCSAREARRPQFVAALATLEQAGARIAGLVVTKLPAARSRAVLNFGGSPRITALPEVSGTSRWQE